MKKNNKILTLALLVFLIPFTIISGQEKKVEKRIKIIVADDSGSKSILDTLITGNNVSDSIILKDGKTIYIKGNKGEDIAGDGTGKKFIITTVTEGGDDTKNEINKEVTVISSESEMDNKPAKGDRQHIHSESAGAGKKQVYVSESGNRDTEKEITKYVIDRDGVRITVEGSDYKKVKDIIKQIESDLDSHKKEEKHPE